MTLITLVATISFAFVRLPEEMPHMKSVEKTGTKSPDASGSKSPMNPYKKNL